MGVRSARRGCAGDSFGSLRELGSRSRSPPSPLSRPTMPLYNAKHYPERFLELKKSIIGDEAALTKAWAELLTALKDATAEYASKGPSMIPIVEFDQLETLGRSAFPPRRRA